MNPESNENSIIFLTDIKNRKQSDIQTFKFQIKKLELEVEELEKIISKLDLKVA